jgi:ERF superfamily
VAKARTPEDRLWEKIYKARKEAEPIVKKGTSDDGSFDFARFEEVLAEAGPLLDKHRLLYIPRMVDEELHFGQKGCLAKAVFEYEVIDLTGGGRTTIRWAGTGFDSPGGSALFKAETGAEKYFLARLLRIPWGTDPEVGNQPAAPSVDLKAAPSEAQRVREDQDRAAEAPQVPRHEKPLPESDLPEPDWDGLKDGGSNVEEVPANV